MPYTIQDGDVSRTYNGFSRHDARKQSEGIAVVYFDGGSDLYDIEGFRSKDIIAEINRMYVDDYGREPCSIVLYDRHDTT